jgi:hypothetical protein
MSFNAFNGLSHGQNSTILQSLVKLLKDFSLKT